MNKTFFTSQDWSAQEHEQTDLGNPGEFPFTRGLYPNMYRGKVWTMRQYAGFGSARESNQRYRELLKAGQTGLSVAFDLPTQMGLDSDDARARSEVGKVGVAISSLEDMQLLLKDLPLGEISTSMTINSTAAILLALYIAVARKRGVDVKSLRGTVQNDILKEYIARGTYIYPPVPSLRLVTDIFEYCAQEVPKWNSISISGYHIREAGSTAVQEIAFTLANARTYVQTALDRGLLVDDFAPRLSFFFNVHNNFFEEIAKFRAARRLWARIIKDEFAAKNPDSMKLRFHTQTAGCSLTAQQPYNNVVRVALQGLAAVLGGTQSLHTNSLDEALGLPTDFAARLALRTQQVVAKEAGVTEVADPVGGSFYVEDLTNQLEVGAKKYLEQIDRLGGVAKCIETGFIQGQIQKSAYEYQKGLEDKSIEIVGVNTFAEKEAPYKPMKLNKAIEREQIQRLKNFKARRKQVVVQSIIEKIRNAAGTKQNLLPLFVDAVENQVTLGEISDALRAVFGEFKEKINV